MRMGFRLSTALLSIFFILFAVSCKEDNSGSQNGNGGGNTTNPDISELTSLQLVHSMGAGWNLGNTLDAHWGRTPAWNNNPSAASLETGWGNPVTTKAMIDFLKAQGITTIRVPVTWYIFTGEAPNYTINSGWMNRVQEVVDYVINNGMFCILNLHHEDHIYGTDSSKNPGAYDHGWLRLYNKQENRNLNSTEKDAINDRVAKLWAQIANRFKDYDEYLIFEGLNEPSTVDRGPNNSAEWEEQSSFLNRLMQTFVDTVRASGGKNADRHLMVTPYFASVGDEVNGVRINNFLNKSTGKLLGVTDSRNRLIVSLHYYEPYGFAFAPLADQYHRWDYPGNNFWNVYRTFDVIKEFVSRGIPVIMGETGALDRVGEAGYTTAYETERVKWAQEYVGGLKELGVPTVVWDDGGGFKLFNRNALNWHYPALAAALIEAAKKPIGSTYKMY